MFRFIYYWKYFNKETDNLSFFKTKDFNTLKALTQWKRRNFHIIHSNDYYILENDEYITILDNKKVTKDQIIMMSLNLQKFKIINYK